MGDTSDFGQPKTRIEDVLMYIPCSELRMIKRAESDKVVVRATVVDFSRRAVTPIGVDITSETVMMMLFQLRCADCLLLGLFAFNHLSCLPPTRLPANLARPNERMLKNNTGPNRN